LALLADPTRFRIMRLLSEGGECNVKTLCSYLAVPQPTVSHHLALMRLHRLVSNRRSGKHVYYASSDGVEVGEGGKLSVGVPGYSIALGPRDGAGVIAPPDAAAGGAEQ